MPSEKLQIYRDTYLLVQQLYKYINNVPKHLRYGEYGHAVSMALDALDLIYVANMYPQDRYTTLAKFLQLIGGVRSRIRLFGELRYLSIKQSSCLALMIDTVYKQAAGWRNSSQHARTVELRQHG